ncbi:MAG: flagellar filament capping protein FliD [Bacillota bacterium]|nr:flagellar filament capping protein FliD [Bacillota bacterium]
MVKSLTSGDQTRIDQAMQQQQTLQWKTEDYQTIISKLTDFQSKYFGDSYNSILIGDSLNQLSVLSTSSPYVSVTTGTNSVAGNVYISDIVSLASSAKLESSDVVSANPTITVDPAKLADLPGKSFKITLDGQEKTLTFDSTKTYASANDVKTELQRLMDASFGSGRMSVAANGNSLAIGAATGSVFSINASGISGQEASDVLGFTAGASNRIDLNAALASNGSKTPESDSGTLEFYINGKQFLINGTPTISQLMTQINNSDAGVTISYSKTTDKFSIVSKETGSASNVTFSDKQGNFLNSILGNGNLTKGTDAVVKLSTSGLTDDASQTTITRSSNSFDIDGTTYTLLGKASGTTQEAINVSIGKDTDSIVKKITDFVNDYNDLLGSITSKLSEERDKDYTPLTDAQKSAMTSTDITNWNTKARSGLLRNDNTLESIANDLRSSLFADVKVNGTSQSIGAMLTDMGITTGAYSEKGKLHIDTAKLTAAVNKDPQKVMDLFAKKATSSYSQYATDAQKQTRYNESGLMWRISDIIKNNTSEVGTKGVLISLVGKKDNSYSTETIYGKQLKDLATKIQDLKDKLSADQQRYYQKFSAMETALTKLNSQSSWLSQQVSANNQQG